MTNTDMNCEQRLLGQNSVETISETETCDGILLRISLYHLTISAREYYVVTSDDSPAGGSHTAAAIVGCNRRSAERAYRKIVRGSVPPATLCEVVFDLISEDAFEN